MGDRLSGFRQRRLARSFCGQRPHFPVVDKQNWGTTWAERPQLFRNLDGVKFQEVPPATGSGLAERDFRAGRGVRRSVQRRAHRRCDQQSRFHADSVAECGEEWKPLGRTEADWRAEKPARRDRRESVRDHRRVRQRADVFSGGSYGSNSDPRVHFGLGAATKVDKMEIHWPDGTKQEIALPGVDQMFTVDEVKGLLKAKE